jgi:hypothetical protein
MVVEMLRATRARLGRLDGSGFAPFTIDAG